MTGQEIYRIVYTSRAVTFHDDSQIGKLAEQANMSNEETGVTGLLLYDGKQFIQAIEGPRETVIELMNRIELDPRHSTISYLYDGLANNRQFGNWAMQYRRVPTGCCSDEFLNRVKDNIEEVDDPYLKAAFIGFAVLGSHRPRGYECRG